MKYFLGLSIFLAFLWPGPASADITPTHEDLSYLSWVRESLNTNTYPSYNDKHLLVYPGVEFAHGEEIEQALKDSKILVVALPEDLAYRVYPRVYAGWLLLREYQFDAVIVLSGEAGGIETRFGWAKCHEVLNNTDGASFSLALLKAIPGVNACVEKATPTSWDKDREKFLTAESLDGERQAGVEIVYSHLDANGEAKDASNNARVFLAATSALLLMLAIFSCGVFYGRRPKK